MLQDIYAQHKKYKMKKIHCAMRHLY